LLAGLFRDATPASSAQDPASPQWQRCGVYREIVQTAEQLRARIRLVEQFLDHRLQNNL
jgi:hypothetical protein